MDDPLKLDAKLFLEMFRRFLPLLWSHQKPDENQDENDDKPEIAIVSTDEFRERSTSDPAPQTKKPSKKKQRSCSMRRNFKKFTKKENSDFSSGT